MKAIDLIIKAEIKQEKIIFLFELLGRYGDKIPNEVQEDMRKNAKDLFLVLCSLKNKVGKYF